MAGLLDFLMPRQSQDPWSGMRQMGPMGGGGGLLETLLSPEVALPMAAQLLGNQGNSANFGNAFAAAGQAMGEQKKLKAQTRQTNMTLEAIRADAPDIAQGIEMGALTAGDGYKMYLERRKAQKGQGIINAGAGNLYNSETGEWLSAPGGGSEGVAGLVPVWLQDENGNPVLGQMTKDGRVIRSEIDKGLTPVGPYQKGFEQQRGNAEGKAAGEAAGALPGVAQMAQKINAEVEDLKNDSSLSNVLGPWDGRTPAILPGSVRAQSKIDALKGGAFLQARQLLKGGGAITDYEGQKAEAAFARLNQAQSEEDFKQALDEFNFYVQQGLAKLQAQAGQQRMGGGYPPQQQAPQGQRLRFNPATGELE
jgi:hypothetical protein